jgi:hypothetical protein
MNVRARLRLLATLAAVAAPIFAASAAHAEQGTVVLTSGEVLSGDITEVVNGDHIVIKLSTGEVRAVAWVALSTLQIGAGGTIQIGGGAPPPPPPPPGQPPPPVVYAPAPPPPTYGYPPPPQPEPPPRFVPRFTLGARVGTLTPGGSLVGGQPLGQDIKLTDYVRSGLGLEGDVGFHFSPSWTVYGFWELGLFAKGSTVGNPTETPVSNFIGIGVNANTSPRGPIGFFVDIAAGYRWLGFSVERNGTTQRFTYAGFEPLRLGLGIAIVANQSFRLHVMAQASGGYFSSSAGGQDASTCTTSSNCNNIPSDSRAMHTFSGLTVGGQFDL